MNYKNRKWLSDLRMVVIFMEESGREIDSPDYKGMKNRIRLMELEESEKMHNFIKG